VEQDVQDCLTALDYVIKEGLIDASKVAVVGISHGGFLTTHLIGQVSILQSLNHRRHLLLAPFFLVFGVTCHLAPRLQAPDRFAVAAARNPVCNLSLMIGTTDIPDWCYAIACGTEAKHLASESPSPDHLRLFYQKSPIAHISEVCPPCLILDHPMNWSNEITISNSKRSWLVS
jgi:acylaminoacyl-peptidase